MARRKKRGVKGDGGDSAQTPCYDVFISYSSKDKEWVRGELLTRIEQAGLKAFIDFRDFTRGAPSINEIERGVVTCRKTLLVLTPDYLKSEWCEYENLILQTLGPANRNLRLLPLLKAQCDLPTRINCLTYIDFTDGADFDLAWLQLLQSLGVRTEPRSVEQHSRDQWFLAHPYPMPPNFTGRTDERDMLSNWLYADPGHPLLVLRALGGFGKSALAWHWLTNDVDPGAWPRVVWWSFYEEPPFESFVSRTLEYLRLRVASQLGPRRQVDALIHTLQLPNILLSS